MEEVARYDSLFPSLSLYFSLSLSVCSHMEENQPVQWNFLHNTLAALRVAGNNGSISDAAISARAPRFD